VDQDRKTRKQSFINALVPGWLPTRGQVLRNTRTVLVVGGTLLGVLILLYVISLIFDVKLLDLLKILAVPITVGAAVPLLNWLQKKRELGIETERAQDEALQGYLDYMSQLLTDKQHPLSRAQQGDDLSTVARARTLTVLARLDADRKARVAQFLYESGLILKSFQYEPGLILKSRQYEPDLIRKRVPQVLELNGADLRNANLHKAALSGAGLRGANLVEADLREANLSRADLRETNLVEADLRGANLVEADLREAILTRADISGAYLREADLSRADLHGGANLVNANLDGANLRGTNLVDVKLRGANLRRATLSSGSLGGADLRGADLFEAEVEMADMEDANLSRAFLRKANLGYANLRGADLNQASLRDANLDLAKLDGANLSYGTDLREADLNRASLEGANLSRVHLRTIWRMRMIDERWTALSWTILIWVILRFSSDEDQNTGQSRADSVWIKLFDRITKTDLSGANLHRAYLKGAILTKEQLTACRSLEGATMPNGQKYEDWLKSRGEDGKNSGSS
jgi:uncharacterized protein YjbI with pentapeptide repeats